MRSLAPRIFKEGKDAQRVRGILFRTQDPESFIILCVRVQDICDSILELHDLSNVQQMLQAAPCCVLFCYVIANRRA